MLLVEYALLESFLCIDSCFVYFCFYLGGLESLDALVCYFLKVDCWVGGFLLGPKVSLLEV
jgi:hypothetical protein